MTIYPARFTPAVLALVISAGCATAPDEPEFKLADAPDVDHTQEQERLHRLQLVRIREVVDVADCDVGNEDPENFLAMTDLASAIDAEVVSRTREDDPSGPGCRITYDYEVSAGNFVDQWLDYLAPYSGDFCANLPNINLACTSFYDAAVASCIASFLYDGARIHDSALPIMTYESTAGWPGTSQRAIEMSPQTTSERIAVLVEARQQAWVALNGLVAGMDVGEWDAEGCTHDDVDYAASIADNYHLFTELNEATVADLLAISDAQRSWTSSVDQGVAWSVGGIPDPGPNTVNLARSEAAHMLVGGDPGLYLNGNAVAGFCTSPELALQTKKAIDIIRSAAPHPLDVLAIPGAPWLGEYPDGQGGDLAPVTLEDFIDGALPNGSLFERLVVRFPALNVPVPGGYGDAYGTGVSPFFGLRDSDFGAARSYLADEIRGFARSLTAVVNPLDMATPCDVAAPTCAGCTAVAGVCDGGSGAGEPCLSDADCTSPVVCDVTLALCASDHEAQRYAATAAPPSTVDPVYWAVVAQHEGQLMMGVGDSIPNPLDPIMYPDQRISMAEVIDWLTYHASTSMAGVSDRAQGVLALLATESDRVAGRLEDTWDEAAGWRADVYGRPPPSATYDLRFVDGEDGLRCAVDGTIEGAPCNLDALSLTTTYNGSAHSVVDAQCTVASTKRLYVVESNDADPRAGSYRALGGLERNAEFTCSIIPGHREFALLADLTDEVSTILAPSKDWCTQSRVSCAGFEFDKRIPLENELTEDGNDVESSWRHYLELANQAADEADALGDDYINYSIQVDDRAETLSLREEDRRLLMEREIEKLQDICGTAMEPSRLLQLLSTGSQGGELDLTGIVDAQAPACAADDDCGEGRMCIATVCLHDPAKLAKEHPEDPELTLLADCMGTDGVLGYVTLGNLPLCLFEADGNPRRPCVGATGSCPSLPDDSVSAATPWAKLIQEWDNVTPFAEATTACDTFLASSVPAGQEDHLNVAIPLGLYDVRESPPPPSLTDDACDAVRQLRWKTNNGDLNGVQNLVSTLRASGIFRPNPVRDLARDLGWHAVGGGISRIRVDGPAGIGGLPGVFYGTSQDPSNTGELPDWPCFSKPLVECGSGREGLFCQGWDCQDPVQLGATNQRLAEAVAALKWMTGSSMGDAGFISNMVIPQYTYIPDPDDRRWSPVLGLPNVEYSSDDPQFGGRLGTYFRSSDPNATAWIDHAGKAWPYKDPAAPGRYFKLAKNATFSGGSNDGPTWNCVGASCDWECWQQMAPASEMIAWWEDGALEAAEPCDVGLGGARPGTILEVGCRMIEDSEYVGRLVAGGVYDGAEALYDVFFKPGYRAGALYAPGQFPEHGWCQNPRPEQWRRWWAGLREGDSPAIFTNMVPAHDAWFFRLWTHESPPDHYGMLHPFAPVDEVGGGLGWVPGAHSWLALPRLPALVWLVEEYPELSIGPGPDYDDHMSLPRSLLDGEHGFDRETLFDAAELYCQLHESPAGQADPNSCAGMNIPPMNSPDDMVAAERFLHCLADDMENSAAHQLLPEFPIAAVSAIDGPGGPGAVGVPGGRIGDHLRDLRRELLDLQVLGPGIADRVRQIGNHIGQLRLAVFERRIDEDLISYAHLSTLMRENAACTADLAPTLSRGQSSGDGTSYTAPFLFGHSSSSGVGSGESWSPHRAAATCANRIAQVNFSGEIERLSLAAERVGTNVETLQMFDDFHSTVTELEQMAIQRASAFERVQGLLEKIRSVRAEGRRALSAALFMGSFQAAKQEQISAAMAARRDVSRYRYEAAREAAVRMAFLAKRSIEQHLGIKMATMREDLPLVAAPSTWESEVCTTTGLDYDRYSNPSSSASPEALASSYIGDYVNKLEATVESFVLVNNFHEGTDTTVVSVRDDLLGVRAPCQVTSRNLLLHSNDLDRIVPDDGDREGWSVEGCPQAIDGGVLEIGACIDVAPSTTVDETFEGPTEFAGGADFGVPEFFTVEGEPGAQLVQYAHLEAGEYVLSWYVSPGTVGAATDPVATVTNADGDTDYGGVVAINTTTYRVYRPVTIPAGQLVRVTVGMPTDGHVGGLMLEQDPLRSGMPTPHIANGDTLDTTAQVCEDTDGEVFRATHWRSGCAPLCDDGFDGICVPGPVACRPYMETEFNINQRSIDADQQLAHAGFAVGNFNYRIENVGVNFVGTGLRNCSDSPSPVACYSGGFLPYSLTHLGPYLVRTHSGEEASVPLYTGNIEHARGLAAERFLTNPLSQSDQGLLNPYMRTELNGRPVSGNFVLRLWLDDETDFEALEDVQLAIDYRYWTRFD